MESQIPLATSQQYHSIPFSDQDLIPSLSFTFAAYVSHAPAESLIFNIVSKPDCIAYERGIYE